MKFNFSFSSSQKTILALGAESAGNFSVFHKNRLYYFSEFGDLLDEKNFSKFQSTVLDFLKKNELSPDLIISDLHPDFKTTALAKELSRKFKAEFIQVQHHHAHVFSSVGDCFVERGRIAWNVERGAHNTNLNPLSQISNLYSIAMDGTGFGLDGKIWGGECFAISNFQFPISKKNRTESSASIAQKNDASFLKIARIGHLENQILLGGELAIKEPARMVISILSKFLPKNEVFEFVKKYYDKNQFELLYNQLQQNFNCQETSSTGRILDAVSVLLSFSGNERGFKHKPIQDLEKNSSVPFDDLKPKIEQIEGIFILNTTHLFQYLTKNISCDKKRLAATAQQYLAEGLHEVVEREAHSVECEAHSVERKAWSAKRETHNTNLKYQLSISNPKSLRQLADSNLNSQLFISGGVSDNKIISSYFYAKGAHKNKTVPHGDAGLSIGQIICHLLSQVEIIG